MNGYVSDMYEAGVTSNGARLSKTKVMAVSIGLQCWLMGLNDLLILYDQGECWPMVALRQLIITFLHVVF